jgi:hypothetical protein
VSEYGDEVTGPSLSFTTNNIEVIDDFEDANTGDTSNSNWSEWKGDTGYFGADNNDRLRGDYVGSLNVAGGDDKSVYCDRSAAIQPASTSAYIVTPFEDENPGDGMTISFGDGTNKAIACKFDYNNDIQFGANISSNTASGSWPNDFPLLFVTDNIDFTNEVFDAKVFRLDAEEVVAEASGVGFLNSVSDISRFTFRNDDSQSTTLFGPNVPIDEPAVET